MSPEDSPLAEEIATMLGRAGDPGHYLVQRLVALVERERQKVHDFHDYLSGPDL